MGIGNTTPSAAIAAALAGGETAAWVGRGTGVDDAGLDRKRVAVQQAVRRIAGVTDPIEVLREVGGSELTAIAAAVVAARHRSLPVVLDGYVVTASVLPLVMVRPDGARPLHRRPLLGRAGPPPAARAARQAPAARPRHAPRRGQRGDGRRARWWRWRAPGSPRSRRSPSGSASTVTPAVRRRRPAMTDRTGFFGAVQFLTRVPVRGRRRPPTRRRRSCGSRSSARSIGAAVGGVAAGLDERRAGGRRRRRRACCSACCVTGAFHEDGLADTADAIAGGWTVERRLEILKDPRHGSYGVAALSGSIVLRIVAVATLGPAAAFAGLVAAHTLGPWRGRRDDGRRARRPARRPRRRLRPLGRARAGRRRRRRGPRHRRRGDRLVGRRRSRSPPPSAAVVIAVVARRALGGVTGDVLGRHRAGRRVPRARRRHRPRPPQPRRLVGPIDRASALTIGALAAQDEPDVFGTTTWSPRAEGWDGRRSSGRATDLRAMRIGDAAILYHSNAKPPAPPALTIIARPTRTPTPFDPRAVLRPEVEARRPPSGLGHRRAVCRRFVRSTTADDARASRRPLVARTTVLTGAAADRRRARTPSYVRRHRGARPDRR